VTNTVGRGGERKIEKSSSWGGKKRGDWEKGTSTWKYCPWRKRTPKKTGGKKSRKKIDGQFQGLMEKGCWRKERQKKKNYYLK